MAHSFVDLLPSEAKLNIFLDGNCFLIASTVTEYFLQQILVRVLADGSIRLLCNAFYDRRSSMFDVVLDGIWAETILTWGSNARCLGEIEQLQSP